MGEDLVTSRGRKGVYVYLNSFWGGSEDKRCVQLSILPNYVQMTYDNARVFFKKCIEEIDKIEAKYNENTPWWEAMSSSIEKETEK